MSTNIKVNRATTVTSNLALMAGLAKYQATISSIMVGGVAVKPADVITTLQAANTAAGAVAPAKAAWQATVQVADDQATKANAMASGVKQALRVMFAGQAPALTDFGLTPRKPRTSLTSDQKAAAAAKAKATRAARNTMGSQQKKSVKGNVAGVTVTPVTTTLSSTPTGTPPAPVSPAAASTPAVASPAPRTA